MATMKEPAGCMKTKCGTVDRRVDFNDAVCKGNKENDDPG